VAVVDEHGGVHGLIQADAGADGRRNVLLGAPVRTPA
jgi:hypothetical protein